MDPTDQNHPEPPAGAAAGVGSDLHVVMVTDRNRGDLIESCDLWRRIRFYVSVKLLDLKVWTKLLIRISRTLQVLFVML